MLSYNGVPLAYTNTIAVVQGPEKDPSGTDTLFFTTRIRTKAVVTTGIDPATGGETPPVTAARIAHLLCSPRRPLLFAPDGTNYIVNLPGGLDDANGPEPDPDAFTIQEITPGSYSVTFSVTVRQTMCQQSLSRPYLSLRWTESTDVGADWLLVKRRSGLLICSSRGPAAPDDLRGLCTPGIYAGFRREQADYQLDETGLRLKFTFVDRQLAASVPWPLTDFEGQMSEIVAGNGLTRKCDFRLKAVSVPGVPKRLMLNVVLMMAMSRVYSTNPFRSKSGSILFEGAIGERLSTKENAIDVHLSWNVQPVKAREKPSSSGANAGTFIGGGLGGLAGGFFGAAFGAGLGTAIGNGGASIQSDVPQAAVAVFAQWLGQPFPFEDPSRGIAPPSRGIAPWVKLAAAALNDPCGQEAVLTAGGGTSELVGSAGGASITASVVPTVTADDEQALYTNAADAAGVWQTCELSVTYFDDTGIRVMAGSVPGVDNSVVRVASRSLTCRCEFHLRRIGAAPTVPNFREFYDPNWVYLRGSTTADAVTVAADGVTLVYGTAGVWEFSALNAKKGLAAFTHPVPPFLERQLVVHSPSNTGTGSASGGGAPSGTGGVTPGPGGGPGGGGFGSGITGGGSGGGTGGSGSSWLSNAAWNIEWEVDHAPYPRLGVLGEVSTVGGGSNVNP